MSKQVSAPERLYHASRHAGPIRTFAPLSHFGSLGAAMARAAAGVFAASPDPDVYEVALRVERPLVIPDLRQTVHSWLKLSDQLFYSQKVLTDMERGVIFDAAAPSGSNVEGGNAALCRVLVSKGYDCIAYRNVHEDAGSISWIALDPSLVEILACRPLSEWTAAEGPAFPAP